MTRNNLGEHLSWLLSSKLSIPSDGDALPPVAISFTQAEPTQSASDIAELEADTRGERIVDHPVQDAGSAQGTIHPQKMARLRNETGSAGRPGSVTMGPRMEEIPHQTASYHTAPSRPSETNAKASSTSKPTPFSTARQVPFSPQDNVEIMDLTESLNQGKSPSANRVARRKRKSSEMAHELPVDVPSRSGPAVSANAMPPPPRGSQQSFTAIDEIMEAPTDPPPPYSTLAPGMISPRQTTYQTAATSRSSTTYAADMSPMMPDSEADEDDLVDFSRSRSRTPVCKKRAVEKHMAMFPERIAESPSKPEAIPRAESFILPEKDVEKALRTTFSPARRPDQCHSAAANTATPAASAPAANGEQSEHNEAVEQFFKLSQSEIEACRQRLNADYEHRLDDLTECMDNDDDPVELQKLLDDAEERHTSMQELANQQKQYWSLLDEKEHLRAALKAAIRARSGLEGAKEASAACKIKLQTLVGDCARLLDLCKNEVTEALRWRASSADGSRTVAVQSTQAPPAAGMNKQSYVPSSSRIAQTQMAGRTVSDVVIPKNQTNAELSRRDSPPNFEAYFSPSRCKPHAAPQHRTQHRPLQQPTVKQQDDNDYGIINESDILEDTDQGFSNRMGTPPTRIDDDDEFGDDIMLDYAEDLENLDIAQRPSRSVPSRPPLAQTSGNSQTKVVHKSPKKKKRTPSKNDDANLEHLFRFVWSNEVKATLRDRFRLRGFRENQLQAINATLAGKDVFVLMPTGGGKSLCYQLPSLVQSGKTHGVTVVISPLLSLMEDQVQHLRKLGIQAFLINSETPQETRKAVMEAMNEQNVEDFTQLLYVTPEMLSKSQKMTNTFERLYRRQRLARLVIDEAHCVSQWGHDFRPDYKLIGDVRKRFPKVPVMALTATATENVKLDTVHNLGITGCEIFTSSFNRPNLYYEVRPKPKGKEDVKHIAELIKEKYARKCGIIYCLSRKNCETMAEALRKEHKIKAHHYHAGLEPHVKREIQRNWQAGVHHVIVATIAFGMGIDKPDVRFVIHHTIPKSLEGYYQETGRAGRDRLESGCYLFYGYQDVSKLRRMIDDGEGDWEQKERQHQMLRRMAQYCDNRSDCRRVQVLRYFNEDFDPEECGGKCDNCCSGSNFQTVDFTEYAQQAVSMVGKIAPQKVTLLHCMDVFRGASTKKVIDGSHDNVDEYGAGKDLDRGDIERLFYHLLTERAIVEENVVNKGGFANQYAALGKHCADFRSGKRKLHMQIRSTPKPKAKAPAKKKAKKDPFEEQSKKWKKTAGSRAPADMPMSTNISSPIQAAASRSKSNRRGAGNMHENGYQRDNFVVSDPEDEYHDESEVDSLDDGFEPIRVGGQQRMEKPRALGRPITADEMMDQLDPVHRDAVEGFVREGKEEIRRIMSQKHLKMAPFSDTMLRHMAVMLTTTEDSMLQVPNINPDNVRLYGKKFCKLVKQFKETYDEMMQPVDRPDPNAQNVIDLVSDEEEEESEDDYGEFPSDDEEDEGEASGYFQPPPAPSAAVAAFTARVDQSQATQAYAEPGPAKQKKAAKGGRKKNYKATGSTAAPRRRNFSGGSRFASYAHEGPSAAGVGKKKASGKRKSGGAGRLGGASGAGRGGASNAGGNRSIVAMMPT